MARGGKREGSGRPKGALTERTRKVAERAMTEGKAPLEVMLDNMRHFQQVALDAEAVIEAMNADEVAALGDTHEQQFKALLAKVKQAAGLRVMAHDCARDAAPYMHARLQAVELTGKNGGAVEVELSQLSDTEVARRVALLLTKGGTTNRQS